MKWKYCLCLLMSCAAMNAGAQKGKMETDRPSETQAAELTEKGFIQIESGFRREQENRDDYRIHHPESVIRYGLTDWLELRAGLTGESRKEPSKNQYRYGLRPVEAGFKAKLLEEKGALPQAALLAEGGLPGIASEDHRAKHLLPRLRLLFQNQLTGQIRLGYNMGAEWKEDDEPALWTYTFSPQLELADRWQLFVEVYGHIQKGHRPEHVVDGGLAYRIGNGFQLDVSAGRGLNKSAPDYFFASGLSFRFGK